MTKIVRSEILGKSENLILTEKWVFIESVDDRQWVIKSSVNSHNFDIFQSIRELSFHFFLFGDASFSCDRKLSHAFQSLSEKVWFSSCVRACVYVYGVDKPNKINNMGIECDINYTNAKSQNEHSQYRS